jgi:hypothetical protein
MGLMDIFLNVSRLVYVPGGYSLDGEVLGIPSRRRSSRPSIAPQTAQNLRQRQVKSRAALGGGEIQSTPGLAIDKTKS